MVEVIDQLSSAPFDSELAKSVNANCDPTSPKSGLSRWTPQCKTHRIGKLWHRSPDYGEIGPQLVARVAAAVWFMRGERVMFEIHQPERVERPTDTC